MDNKLYRPLCHRTKFQIWDDLFLGSPFRSSLCQHYADLVTLQVSWLPSFIISPDTWWSKCSLLFVQVQVYRLFLALDYLCVLESVYRFPHSPVGGLIGVSLGSLDQLGEDRHHYKNQIFLFINTCIVLFSFSLIFFFCEMSQFSASSLSIYFVDFLLGIFTVFVSPVNGVFETLCLTLLFLWCIRPAYIVLHANSLLCFPFTFNSV